MGKSVLLAAILTLLGGMAFAEHAISLEPEAAPAAKPAPATPPAAAPAPPPPVIVQVPKQPAPQVTLPPELDVYLIPAATHQVCTVSDWGFGEIRRECRTEELPPLHGNPALRGICTIRYGLRTCY